MNFVLNLLDSIPVVGHTKGLFHYAAGDKEAGNKAMYQATRTSAVLGAGAVGSLAGPGGAAAAAMYAGALTDTVASAAFDSPQGIIKDLTNIKEDVAAGKRPVNSIASTGIHLVMDGAGGLGMGGVSSATTQISENIAKKTVADMGRNTIQKTVQLSEVEVAKIVTKTVIKGSTKMIRTGLITTHILDRVERQTDEEQRAREERAREEREQRAREEREQRAREEREQRAREEREERTAEEEEQRAREERAREEREQRAREEREQRAREGREERAREEREQRAREEREERAAEEEEQRAREERKQRARLEIEQRAREESEQRAREEREERTAEEEEQRAREERAREEEEHRTREEREQRAREESEQPITKENEQCATKENEQCDGEERKQGATDESEQCAAEEGEQRSTEKSEQSSTQENKQGEAKKKQHSKGNNKKSENNEEENNQFNKKSENNEKENNKFSSFITLLENLLTKIFGNKNSLLKKRIREIFNKLNSQQQDYVIKIIKEFQDINKVIELVIIIFKDRLRDDITFVNFLSLSEFVAVFLKKNKPSSTVESLSDLARQIVKRFLQIKEEIESVLAETDIIVPNFRDLFTAVYHYFKHQYVKGLGNLSVREYYCWIRNALKYIKRSLNCPDVLKESYEKKLVKPTRVISLIVVINGQRAKIIIKCYQYDIVISTFFVLGRKLTNDKEGDVFL